MIPPPLWSERGLTDRGCGLVGVHRDMVGLAPAGGLVPGNPCEWLHTLLPTGWCLIFGAREMRARAKPLICGSPVIS